MDVIEWNDAVENRLVKSTRRSLNEVSLPLLYCLTVSVSLLPDEFERILTILLRCATPSVQAFQFRFVV